MYRRDDDVGSLTLTETSTQIVGTGISYLSIIYCCARRRAFELLNIYEADSFVSRLRTEKPQSSKRSS